MLKIRSRGNETVEQMLKRFKKLCEKEGLTKEIKRNSYYEKPSERSAADAQEHASDDAPEGGSPLRDPSADALRHSENRGVV